eukprot:5777077-Prymnesium_polylepis.1
MRQPGAQVLQQDDVLASPAVEVHAVAARRLDALEVRLHATIKLALVLVHDIGCVAKEEVVPVDGTVEQPVETDTSEGGGGGGSGRHDAGRAESHVPRQEDALGDHTDGRLRGVVGELEDNAVSSGRLAITASVDLRDPDGLRSA